MCDANIYDKIVGDDEVLRRLDRDDCPVRIVATHVQDDEHAQIPDEQKRQAFVRSPRRRVPTADFVIGFSRLDQARLGGGAAHDVVQGQAKPGKHSRDGLIAGTAATDADVLVTEDGRLRRRAQEAGVAVWAWEEFRDAVLQ
jgi:hypothetical protein